MNVRLTLALSVLGVVVILGGSLGLLLRYVVLQRTEEALQGRLAAIAAAAAAGIDGDAHDRIASAHDPEFVEIREHLRRVRRRTGLETEIYTLSVVSEYETRFVVMTNETPFLGHSYGYRLEMTPTLGEGRITTTGIYEDANGRWISAYAPITASDGRVVALLEVDETAETVHLRNREV